MNPVPQLPAPLDALHRRDESLVEPPAVLNARLLLVEHLLALVAVSLSTWCRAAGARVLPTSYASMSLGSWVEWAERAALRLRKTRFAPTVAAAWLDEPLSPQTRPDFQELQNWLSRQGVSARHGAGSVTANAFAKLIAPLRNRTRGHGDPMRAAPELVPALNVLVPSFANTLAPLWRGGLLRIDAIEGTEGEGLIVRGVDLATPEALPVRTILRIDSRVPGPSDLWLRLAALPPDGTQSTAQAFSLRPWLLASLDPGGPTQPNVIHVYNELRDGKARYLDTSGDSRVDQALGREILSLAEQGLDERERLTAGLDTLKWEARRQLSDFINAYLGGGENPNPFCGRDEDVQALLAFIDRSAAPRHLLVTAPLGRGKSALLVRVALELAGRADVATIVVPVSLRFDISSEQRVLQVLVARLLRLHNIKGLQWELVTVEALRRRVGQLLDEPLPDGRRLVLLLDGVDEATGFRIGPDVVPREAPEHLRVIVSARSRPNDDDGIEHLLALGWDTPGLAERHTLVPLDASDVEAALRRHEATIARLADHPEAVRELTRIVRGDPLTLWLLLRELSAAPAVRDDVGECISWLRAREPGLKGWFKSYWEQQRRQWGADAPLHERAVQSLLFILAVTDVALDREDLLAIARDEIANTFVLDDALASLVRLVHRDGGERGYVMAHVGLAMYLRDNVLTPSDEEAWRARIDAYVRGVVADVAAGRRPSAKVPRSVRRSAATCLRRAKASPSEWSALATRA